MILPIIKRLRKRVHRDTAMAQDLMVIELYNAPAIWDIAAGFLYNLSTYCFFHSSSEGS